MAETNRWGLGDQYKHNRPFDSLAVRVLGGQAWLHCRGPALTELMKQPLCGCPGAESCLGHFPMTLPLEARDCAAWQPKH